MIAYDHKSLDNLLINDETGAALYKGLISKEESDAIERAYSAGLYTPNLFIRIGLFLLTAVIVSMSFGFFCLIIASSSEKGFGALAIIFSLITYAALEFLIHEKNHYRSGMDDALLWLSMGFLTAGINMVLPFISSQFQAVLVFVPAFYAALRFGNALMAGVAFMAFLAIIFYSIIPLGAIAKVAMPFLLMAVSFLVYRLIKKIGNDHRARYYANCCTLVQTLALVTLYAAGNYFAVREVSNEMFNLHLKEEQSIPGGWFFWIITILLPVLYIFRGVHRKNAILLRTGLVLVVAVAGTIRYYYHMAPPEIVMTIGGIVMIAVAYAITKYLSTPRHGFTQAEPNDPQFAGLPQLESLAIAQTFQPAATTRTGEHTHFGGGSGGGGGATGQY